MKWKLFGSPFTWYYLFLGISQNEVFKTVLNFDFCYFWNNGEDFSIRGVVDMIVLKNGLFFFFGLSW